MRDGAQGYQGKEVRADGAANTEAWGRWQQRRGLTRKAAGRRHGQEPGYGKASYPQNHRGARARGPTVGGHGNTIMITVTLSIPYLDLQTFPSLV